jgi:serine/threonine protein phosphatase PrpC
MGGYKSFAVSVQGGSHIKSQDVADLFNYESVSIAIVADGHGDSSCFRSAIGASLAVVAARNGIWQFIKEYEPLFKSGAFKKPDPPSHRELEKLIREKLIRQTVAKWNKDVMDDYQNKPFTEDELKTVSSEKYRKRYENGERISHAYGTTLIAVAITPQYWFGYHIGDGRFTILNEDSSGGQPVPWDPRCFLNVVTSICDEDILDRGEEGVRIHLSFYSEEAPPPVAFFLCSDGIDDNYPADEKINAECLYGLYRDIAVTFAEAGYEITCGNDGKSGKLKDLATRFATDGKGDDTSIAGIVNIEKLRKVAPSWKEKMDADKKAKEEAKAVAAARVKAEAEEREKAAEVAATRSAARRSEAEAEEKAKAEKDVKKEPQLLPETEKVEEIKADAALNAVSEAYKKTLESVNYDISKQGVFLSISQHTEKPKDEKNRPL